MAPKVCCPPCNSSWNAWHPVEYLGKTYRNRNRSRGSWRKTGWINVQNSCAERIWWGFNVRGPKLCHSRILKKLWISSNGWLKHLQRSMKHEKLITSSRPTKDFQHQLVFEWWTSLVNINETVFFYQLGEMKIPTSQLVRLAAPKNSQTDFLDTKPFLDLSIFNSQKAKIG